MFNGRPAAPAASSAPVRMTSGRRPQRHDRGRAAGRAIAAVGVEQLGMLKRAPVQRLDLFRGDARVDQLPAVCVAGIPLPAPPPGLGGGILPPPPAPPARPPPVLDPPVTRARAPAAGGTGG